MVATFGDDDPNGFTGDYSARIDWGDGTRSIGMVMVATGGGFVVGGNHSFAQGSFTITTTVNDQGRGIDIRDDHDHGRRDAAYDDGDRSPGRAARPYLRSLRLTT